MKVLLVEPFYNHPFPHLFLLKAITYWQQRGAWVTWTKGYGIELSEDPDLIQVTTPIFSWAVPASIEQVNYYKHRFPRSEIQIGGVMGTLHAGLYEEKTGIRPFEGVHPEIIHARPAWQFFPQERVCRVMITAGCSVACNFCLVTPMYGARSYEVYHWEEHFVEKPVWHVIDDNLSQALMTIKGLDQRLLSFFQANPHKFDLNSGVEPRSFTDKVAETMLQLPIRPWRTAMDDSTDAEVKSCLRTLDILKQHNVDMDYVHVYLLYGWKDDLEDALHRLSLILEAGAVPFAMRYVPLDWFGTRNDYRPEHWDPLHWVDFARYVNQMKRRSLHSKHRWTFNDFLDHCASHKHVRA